jgi:predicted  nucleic acid-binding Zn-ribbon protein
MPKAPAAEQLRLLDLAALDAKLHSLDVRRRALEADPRLGPAKTALEQAAEAARSADALVAGAEAELAAVEAKVAEVSTRIARDESRLYAGGLSKDLEALQKDIAGLSARQSDLEDTELEVLEKLDGLRAAQGEAAEALGHAQAAGQDLRDELDEQLGAIAQERSAVAQQRSDFAAGIDAGLLDVYEKTLAKRGVGAARLFHGTSEGSGMALSPGDLAAIRSAAEDEIVFCPDSGCILVRSPEWS